MSLEVLFHPESFDLLLPEDGLHGFVGSEPLLYILGVLKVVFLQVGPQVLHNLRPVHLLILGKLEERGEIGRHLQRLLEARAFLPTHPKYQS